MRLFNLFIVAPVFLASESQSFAAGTDEFGVVDRLLRSQPNTYKWLSSSLIFPDSVVAEVRLGSHFTELGGARTGPYSFKTHARNSKPSEDVEVVVCTTVRFLDKAGRQLPESKMHLATRIDEKLESVHVRDPKDQDASSACAR